MKKIALMLVMFGSVFLAACATSPKTQVVQAGDNHLSCNQIKAELAKLDQAENEINSKKGMTGTNVAAALFWLPGLAYTYYDAGQAEQALTARKSYLTSLYNDNKNCR